MFRCLPSFPHMWHAAHTTHHPPLPSPQAMHLLLPHLAFFSSPPLPLPPPPPGHAPLRLTSPLLPSLLPPQAM